MTLLSNIITENRPSAPKGIIYGSPGVGKSTFGASATDSLVIDCENGVSAIRCQRTPYLATWPEILAWLQTIETEEHPYRTVVVDTCDWLLRRVEEHITGGDVNATLTGGGNAYGVGNSRLKNYAYQILLPIFDRIVNRGIAVILLAHADRREITDIDGITIEKTSPDIHEKLRSTIIEWSDFVCLARMDGEGNRQLITRETPRALAKNRYNLPATLPFDWSSFEQAVTSGLNS